LKVLYVTTISNTINAFLIPHIQLLLDQGFQVDIACNIIRPINPQLLEQGCRLFNIGFQRSPLKKGNYTAYRQLKQLIHEEKYDLIHTHTPSASAIVRLATRKMKNVKVIYTAHGFHFFKGAPLKNWLIYYPIERWLAHYTDVLITINKEDYDRAKKSFKAGRVESIQGVGLDTKKFSGIVIDKSEKRKQLGVPTNAALLLSVGELNNNKNHKTIIKALVKLNDPNIYYIICGVGSLKEQLEEMIKIFGLSERVKLLGLRSDVNEICQIADIFVFPSFREGLSVALMEAMASGLPVVCSNIRGNNDLIVNGKGGYLVPPTDVIGYCNRISNLVNNETLRKQMGEFNKRVIEQYKKERVLAQMRRIYAEVEYCGSTLDCVGKQMLSK